MLKLNEKGFTLVESLVSLSCFCIIVSLCSFPLNSFIQWSQRERVNLFEWELFIQQMRHECYKGTEIFVQNDKLYIRLTPIQLVSYERYGNKLRRRVNHTGHEVLVQNIRTVIFKEEKGGIKIYLEDENQNYEAQIVYYHDVIGD